MVKKSHFNFSGKFGKKREFIEKYKLQIVVVIAIITSFLVGHVLIKQPLIAVIEVKDKIDGRYADGLIEMINLAYENEEIKAVVLDISSPGGEASAVESVYMALLELKKVKPVVAAVKEVAASGAYYLAITANKIYVAPSSTIGSVGIVSVLPEPRELEENTIISGPFKKLGSSRKKHTYEVKVLQDGFLNAVMENRKGKINLGRAELSEARVYLGNEALELGLIDELGSELDAIKKAAELAGITNYKIEKLGNKKGVEVIVSIDSLTVDENIFKPTNTVAKYYYLYIARD